MNVFSELIAESLVAIPESDGIEVELEAFQCKDTTSEDSPSSTVSSPQQTNTTADIIENISSDDDDEDDEFQMEDNNHMDDDKPYDPYENLNDTVIKAEDKSTKNINNNGEQTEQNWFLIKINIFPFKVSKK